MTYCRSEPVKLLWLDEIDTYPLIDNYESDFLNDFNLIKEEDNESVNFKVYKHKTNNSTLFISSTKPFTEE